MGRVMTESNIMGLADGLRTMAREEQASALPASSLIADASKYLKE